MYKVLIVDDEYDIRNSFARFLPWNESGFVVAGQAEDGLEARRFVENNNVDVVFCDIQMPRATGLDFAKWAFRENKPFVTVFLSAYRKFEFAQEALRYGVRRYLVKPPSLQDFTATLDALREELDERNRSAAAAAVAEGPAGEDPIAETVRTYIAGDPANANIEEAARLVRRSPHYLSTYFKERTGETFSTLLLRTKMERALDILKDRSVPIHEASRMVGYSNPKNFSRAFASYYGCSPRDFMASGLPRRESEA